MQVCDLQNLGPHHARALAEWRRRVHNRAQQIRSLGFDEWSSRRWDYYFGYCEPAFTEREGGVSQIVLGEPDCRVEPSLSSFE